MLQFNIAKHILLVIVSPQYKHTINLPSSAGAIAFQNCKPILGQLDVPSFSFSHNLSLISANGSGSTVPS